MKHQVVIIGSGLGGLLTAVFLAKHGYGVTVLEQNKQIGGCLQTFSFDKKVFDSAVHYIGALGKGEVLHQIFSYAGIMKDLKLERMALNCFDATVLEDSDILFELGQGIDGFRKSLLQFFPQEAAAIHQYISLLEDTCAAVPLYNLRMGDEAEKESYIDLSLTDVMQSIGASETLQYVLTGNAILYAGVANTTPWLTHALVTKSYIDSAWRCAGGASQISKLLWRQLQVLDGHVYNREKVSHLQTKNGLVVAAHSASGKVFYADHFISNIHPKQTIALLDNPNLLKSVYKNRVNNASETIGCIMVNIVLQPGKVSYKPFNINWNLGNPLTTAERSKNDFPANYSIYYTEDQQHRGFAESVSILSYIDANEFSIWETTYNNTIEPSERDENYTQYKTAKAAILLNKIAARFPELKQYKKSWKIATPLTYRDYQGSEIGSLYGIEKDVNNRLATSFSTKTRLPNLHLTGQNVNLHGILGVSMTAIQTAASFIGMEVLLEEINST